MTSIQSCSKVKCSERARKSGIILVTRPHHSHVALCISCCRSQQWIRLYSSLMAVHACLQLTAKLPASCESLMPLLTSCTPSMPFSSANANLANFNHGVLLAEHDTIAKTKLASCCTTPCALPTYTSSITPSTTSHVPVTLSRTCIRTSQAHKSRRSRAPSTTSSLSESYPRQILTASCGCTPLHERCFPVCSPRPCTCVSLQSRCALSCSGLVPRRDRLRSRRPR